MCVTLHLTTLLLPFSWPNFPSAIYKTPLAPLRSLSVLSVLKSLYIILCIGRFLCCPLQEPGCASGDQMDHIVIEKISATKKSSKSRRQQLLVIPTLTLYLVATSILCLLLTSPVWFPRLCSFLRFFLLTTLPDLATYFLLSPKCLFVVGNLIVAFLVGESRLAPRRDQPSLLNEIHEEHVKRNMAKMTAAAVVVADHSPFVGAVEGEEVKEEEAGEEELHKRVEDFIARVKKQRKLEAKSFFDVDR